MKHTKISSRAGGTASKTGYVKRDGSGAFKGVARASDTRVRGSRQIAGKSVDETYSKGRTVYESPGKAAVHSITKSVSFFEKNKTACGSLKNAPSDLSYNPDYLETDK